MKRRFLALTAVIVAFVLIVSACGGADPTATPAPTATPVPTAMPTAMATAMASPVATATPQPTPTPAPTATPAAPQPEYGGTFRMRVSFGAAIANWNVYGPGGQWSVIGAQNLLNNLTFLDPVDGNTIRPDLAETWSVDSGGTELTYNLQRDATWHDGTPFTANDVLFSLDRAKNPIDSKAALHTSRMKIVEGWEAPDDYTVKIRLMAPSASFATLMSIPSMQIYPAHMPDIEKWQASPVGTGAFKFKDFKIDVSKELVRNDQYFKKDASGNSLPYLDGVIHLQIPDRALTLAAFRSGELDCLCGYTSDITAPEKDPMARNVPDAKFGVAVMTVNYLGFNQRPPFDNLKVRQAIHIGFDRLTATETYRLGEGLYPPTYFVPDTSGGRFSLSTEEYAATPGFRVKDGNKDPADMEMARQLLSEAGFEPGDITLNFITSTGTLKDLGELLTTLLGDIGIKVNATFAVGGDRNEVLRRGDFDLFNQPGPNAYEDPQDVIIPSTTTGGPLNWAKWSFPEIDQLAEDQQRQLDPAKRIELVKDLQRGLLERAIYVPGNHMAPIFAAHSYVEDYALNRAFNASSAHKLEAVWFSK